MYARDFLRAGDYMEVVPMGLMLTLEYNENGNLSKIYQGYDGERFDVSDKLLNIFQQSSTAPLKIGLRGGTTWVKGVLYTNINYYVPTAANKSIESMMIESFQKNSKEFNFFAGHVSSGAGAFVAAAPIRSWLQGNQFHVLPGYLIPTAPVTAKMFDDIVNTSQFPFKYPLIQKLMVFRGKEFHIFDNELRQLLVRRVIKEVDENGFIWGNILTSDSKVKLKVSFTDVTNYNLNPSSLMVIDQAGRVIYSVYTDNKHHDPRPRTITCTTCGRKIKIPTESGDLVCPNKHCRSRMLGTFNHFLVGIGLSPITPLAYKQYISDGELLCLSDVFTLAEYYGSRTSISISKLLRAIIPLTEIQRSDVITLFCSRCNNAIETVMYYADHADEMLTSLNMRDVPDVDKLIEWMNDTENSTDVKTLLNCEQIIISENDKKFDGPQIFRNMNMFITGKFLHGSLSDITGIIQSYGAKIVPEVDTTVKCVIIGDIPQGINGSAVRTARNLGIKVFQEGEFFKAYEIDEDLQKNLV